MLKESAYKKKTKLRYLCDISAHSMEEAEELCDRVGIFVSGNFHCLGTPNEVCTLESRTMLVE
jgi:ABC-type multidrug transport system ATPase subunit